MTELKTFLVALYDSLSEAEIKAFVHGQARMAELDQAGSLPGDISVPVYHAKDMNISLNVGLEVERSETGHEMHIIQPPPDDKSQLTFTVDVFDLIETQDITDVDPKDVIDDLPSSLPRPSDDWTSRTPPEEKFSQEDTDVDDDTGSGEPSDTHHKPDSVPSEGDAGTGREVEERPITAIDTIETSTATILENSGIETVADLLTRTPHEIAETVGATAESVSIDRAATWRRDAQAAVGSTENRESQRPVEDIEGIGPTYGERLREAGIETVGDLAGRPPDVIAKYVSTENLTVTPRRAEHWIEEAEGWIGDIEDGDPNNEQDPTE